MVTLLHPTRQPNGRPEFESHHWLFKKTFPSVLVVIKWLFSAGTISIRECGDQNRCFKQSHDALQTLTKCFFL